MTTTTTITPLPPLAAFPVDLQTALRALFDAQTQYERTQAETMAAEKEKDAVAELTPIFEEQARRRGDKGATLKALALSDTDYRLHLESLNAVRDLVTKAETNLSIVRRRHDTFRTIAERIPDVRFVVEGSAEHQRIVEEATREFRRAD